MSWAASRSRLAATVLGVVTVAGALVFWPTTAPAQNSGPVPYTQLIRREPHAAAPKRVKPKPKRIVHASSAAVTTASGVAAGAQLPPARVPSVAAPSTGQVASPQGGTAAAPRPSPAVPTAGVLPGSAPAVLRPAARVAAPVPPPAPPPPELPSAAAAPPPAAASGARLAAKELLPAAETEAFVDGVVRQAAAERPLAGVAVAVVQGGRSLLSRGWGYARPGAAVDPRTTRFRLGSASEVFTWIEVLKAVEAGRLHLDESVNARLPRALAVPDDGFREPVRLRNLMAHDAGFESREFGRLFLADPDARHPLAETLRERPHRVRPPGDTPTYSPYGAALAGYVAAEADRLPFDRLVTEDLLRPAGLTATSFGEPGAARDGLPPPLSPAQAAALAEGQLGSARTVRRPGPASFGYAGGWAPALSASATAEDMARFMLAFLADGRAPGAAAPLWGPRTDAALRTPMAPGWAHGLLVYDLPGGFRGFGQEGAAPGFRAKLVMVPQLDLGVFVAANSDTAARLVDALPALLVGRFYAAAPSAGGAATALPDAAAYNGTYVATRRTYHGLEGFADRLGRMVDVRSGDDGALVVAARDGARRWLATGQPGRLVAADGTGEPLRVLFDGAGRPRALLDPAGLRGLERVDPLHRPGVLATAAGLAALASLLTLAGLFVRDPREYRQSDRQRTASRLQSFTALLWLLVLAAFGVFAGTGGLGGDLMRRWPDPWLVGASCSALGATLLTLAQLAQLPGALSSARRVQGWSAGRKLRHTLTVLVFAGFGFVLLGWGALEPWSS